MRFGRFLTASVAGLAAAATGIGILGDVYRDPELFIRAGWLGNDIVALLVLVPALAWSALAAQRRWVTLVRLGALSTTVYNYAFYAFGAAANPLFLLHVAIVALALLALIADLVSLDAPAYPPPTRPVRRFLVVYMGLWAILLAALWTLLAVSAAAAGEAPELSGSTRTFQVTAALDLILVVPYVALAATLVALKRPWATPAAAILNVKGVIYPAVLIASSTTAHLAGVPGALDLVPLWIAFLVASGAATYLLLRRCV